MSLEDRIHENTLALNALAEILKKLSGNIPPTAPAPVTSVKPAEAKAPVKEKKPAEAKPAEKPVDLKALRTSLVPKIKTLFSKNAVLGKQILDKFNAKNLSSLPDDQLPSFASEVDATLQGI